MGRYGGLRCVLGYLGLGVLSRDRCTASWRAGDVVLHQGAVRSPASMIRAS
jgi:hypothetical protein